MLSVRRSHSLAGAGNLAAWTPRIRAGPEARGIQSVRRVSSEVPACGVAFCRQATRRQLQIAAVNAGGAELVQAWLARQKSPSSFNPR
jgi:hypothetical protein